MQWEFEARGEVLVVTIRGELDHHTAAALRAAIDKELMESGQQSIIFDMSGVGFADSSGIAVIMGRYNKVRKLGGKAVISGCGRHVERIFSMAGIFNLMEQTESVDEAVKLFGKEGGEIGA